MQNLKRKFQGQLMKSAHAEVPKQLLWTVKWLVVEAMEHLIFVLEFALLMKMRM